MAANHGVGQRGSRLTVGARLASWAGATAAFALLSAGAPEPNDDESRYEHAQRQSRSTCAFGVARCSCTPRHVPLWRGVATWSSPFFDPYAVAHEDQSPWPSMVWGLPADARERWPEMRRARDRDENLWPDMVWRLKDVRASDAGDKAPSSEAPASPPASQPSDPPR
ncbi:MAG: hypothetical protein AB7G17_09020 [Phycisphaerales bacterium]